MSVTRQLYQLQELDLEIEANEQALQQKESQLGENQAIISAQNQVASEQQRLEELKRQQHTAEWEVDDLLSKVAAVEAQLYGGKITNPKELSNLQHEATTMKAKSDQLENRALEIIDRVEAAEKSLEVTTGEFKKQEVEWHRRQQQLSDEIAQLKRRLADLNQNRLHLSGEVQPQAVELYEKIRQQKKSPVAKVEQGICRGCRISLSANELQRARSGNPVQCGSCGRILFLS